MFYIAFNLIVSIMFLSDLPNELLIKIAEHLYRKGVIALARTNKHFFKFVDDWLYKRYGDLALEFVVLSNLELPRKRIMFEKIKACLKSHKYDCGAGEMSPVQGRVQAAFVLSN